MASVASCYLSLYASDVILLCDQQLSHVDFNEHALASCDCSREGFDARVPGVQGRIALTPPICSPNGMPSRGEGS
jgi:hypothetical protein